MYEKLALELYHNGELQLEPEYVGRGMSSSCHALVGSYTEFMDSLTTLLDATVENALACETEQEKAEVRAAYNDLRLESLSSLRTDNLGNSIIFY